MVPPKAPKLPLCRLFSDTCKIFRNSPFSKTLLSPLGWVWVMLTQFSTLYRSKMEIFAKQFFDIVTTYNDEICYVTHVLAPFYVFFTLFGCWGGGAPKRSRAQLQNSFLIL